MLTRLQRKREDMRLISELANDAHSFLYAGTNFRTARYLKGSMESHLKSSFSHLTKIPFEQGKAIPLL